MLRSKLMVRAVVLMTCGVVLSLTCSVRASAAEAPRWVIRAVTSPTHIQAETPRDEVQSITVNASGGTFAVELRPLDTGTTQTSTSLSYDATHEEVQAALAAIPGMEGAGVAVTGGPGTATPREYTVTFVGAQADNPIELMGVNASKLTGGGASVTELRRGVTSSQVVVTATNVGGAATNGGTVTLTDALPSWLKATRVEGVDGYAAFFYDSSFGAFMGAMSCSTAAVVTCTYSSGVDAGDELVMLIEVEAGAAPLGEQLNRATVSGGGAPEARDEGALNPNDVPVGEGVSAEGVYAALSSTQAGGHPNFVTSFWLNTKLTDTVAGTPKDVRFDLPPGLVGNTVGVPRCSMNRVIEASNGSGVECPRDAMVGVAEVYIAKSENGTHELVVVGAPVYNIAPAPGEPAAFGFNAIALPVRLDTSVLSDGDYGVRVTAGDLSQAEPVVGSTVTIWGVPAEHSGPGTNSEYVYPSPHTLGGVNEGQTAVPLLTNPQQCAQQLLATMSSDTWNRPGDYESVTAPIGSLTGCLEVPFGSAFSFLPDTLEAGAPAGYHFALNVPQQNAVGTLATSSVREVHLSLPEGVVVNPSAAWGLKACDDAQFYGPDHPRQEPAAPEECPRAAVIGEVEVETPDLEKPLKGQVFLGTPECDPCTPKDAEDGAMVRLFLQLEGEGESGIIVKLEGHADIDQATGQITTVFKETPQLPFDRMRFVLEGGPRAVLANPRKCGLVKTTGDLAPWSDLLAPGEAGVVSDSTPFYEFEINENCFGPRFVPSFKAGMPNIQAGAHGEFTLAFGREDDSEFLNEISVQMPEGLLGSLTGIPLCPEAQANAGNCSAASEIGTVEALTGPGANPFLVSGGHVYLSEGYGGSQFGLSIVVPAVAGPYTLGGLEGKGNAADSGTVVVRSQIFIDRHTAQLTVRSSQLPSMLDGIPLQLKAVNVRINRPGFMFNPTSCERKQITGTLTAVEGMSANVTSPFQVTNCAALAFKPGFKASTKSHHTRKGGAYLQVNVTSSEGQADIAKARVELPKKLPSRLSTLQQACTEAQFEANPAGCPAASVVGSVLVHTPVLPVPLTGPAYFVSRGAQWPELIMVLQGYGVTVDLNGETHISKAGVTSTTLNTVPDVPFTSFTLTLPEGSHSALAGNGNLCKKHLIMPIQLSGQNGAQVEKSIKVKVNGCAATRKKGKHHRKHRQKKHKAKAGKHKAKAGKHKAKAGKHKAKAGKHKARTGMRRAKKSESRRHERTVRQAASTLRWAASTRRR